MIDQPQGNITTIRVVTNMTSQELNLVNLEQPDGRDNLNVQANVVAVSHPGATPVYIPWCDSGGGWNSSHIHIDVGDAMGAAICYSIWQSGPLIRYSTDGAWHHDGDAVPGDAGIGDQKIVIIAKDLSLRMAKLSSDPYT